MFSYISAGQKKLNDLQVSVSTEMVSQNYSGIARESSRLLNLETTSSITTRFSENNSLMQGRLKMVDTALDSIDTVMRDFRHVLNDEGIADPPDESQINKMQEAAFRALEDIEYFLNSKLNGRYLFSGSQVSTKPVDLGLTSLEDFQARFDGSGVTYPTTRDAHLEQFEMSQDSLGATNWLTFERDSTGAGGASRITSTTAEFSNIAVGTTLTIAGTPGGDNDTTVTVAAVGGGGTYIDVVSEYFQTEPALITDPPVAATLSLPEDATLDATATLDPVVTGGLRFAAGPNPGDPETLTATTAGSLADLTPGSTFSVTGSANNDGTYTVLDNDGTTITIDSKKLVDSGAIVAGSLTASSYYRGDSVSVDHAVDKQRNITTDLNAIDPSFEKAIRAMGLIAQGDFATEGGLDQNVDRIQQAKYLISSAIDSVVSGSAPFGMEANGSMESVRIEIGFQQVVLRDALDLQTELVGRYETEASDIEMVDTMEAVAKLLDQSTALEASMHALSRVSKLSLVNYL
jgi:flagellin-like hook-associated protein FlgL